MALVTLPPELLLRISTFLTTPELGNLRLTCKHIEVTLFDSFAREFFTKKQFMLEEISLQALVDISNHPTLASRLSEVVISTHAFPSDSEMATPFDKAMYKAGYISHEILLASGQALSMLSEAFSNLPNLRTVGLRDYNGLSRYRDGEFATWKSWGWSFGWEDLHRYVSAGPYQRSLRIMSPGHIFPVLLYALGHAKARPDNIHVFLRKRAKLASQSFHLLDGYLGKMTRPVLGDLKEIMLAIGFNDSGYSMDSPSAADAPLQRLLQCAPKLRSLRLNFEPHASHGPRFLEWLGAGSESGILPCLTSIELGMLKVSRAVLLKVLTKFDLESFSLWKCILCPIDDDENCWQLLLHELAKALREKTRLKSVLIGYPSQMGSRDGPGLGEDNSIVFADNLNKSVQVVKHHAGPGTNIRRWLEEASARVIKVVEEDSEVYSEMSNEDDENEESQEEHSEDEVGDDE